MKKYPRYLNLSKEKLEQKINQLFQILENCHLCPRNCGVNRLKNEKGFCKLGFLPKVSSTHPHFGEESVLVGSNGSGTIFFSNCNLSCVYCQNFDISQLGEGQEISFEKLAQLMLHLQKLGCHNINLVSPTPQIPQILKSLSIAIEKGLTLPIVYNTGTYDSFEVLKILEGIIDIYMPDSKYSNSIYAEKYSQAPNYFEIFKKSLTEMHRQVGDLVIENGIARTGLLVRHLILPNNLAGSKEIFEFIANEISKNTFVNIMDQYHPCYKANNYPELTRRITPIEFWEAVEMAKKAGLKRFIF